MPAGTKCSLNLSPPVGYSTRDPLSAPRHLPLSAVHLAGRRETDRLPRPRQAVAANGLPVQAVVFAAPQSCEVILGARGSPSSRRRFRFAGPLAWSPEPRPCPLLTVRRQKS